MQPLERTFIESILKQRQRSCHQINQPFSSDAEIIRVGDLRLAITTDTIAEEISRGLIRDAYAIGWLAGITCLSDLAAVGAKPLGVVCAIGFPLGEDHDFAEGVMMGLIRCLEQHGTSLLGGDTNDIEKLQVTTTAIGVLSTGKFIGRQGRRAGDKLYCIGAIGGGNALALANLRQHGDAQEAERQWRPVINFNWIEALPAFVSSGIDTSDGFLPTLSLWLEACDVGFQIDVDTISYDAVAQQLADEMDSTPLLFAAGQVGEYSLLFTVPTSKVDSFEAHARAFDVQLSRVGHCIDAPELVLGKRHVSKRTLAALSGFDTAEQVVEWVKHYA